MIALVTSQTHRLAFALSPSPLSRESAPRVCVVLRDTWYTVYSLDGVLYRTVAARCQSEDQRVSFARAIHTACSRWWAATPFGCWDGPPRPVEQEVG